MSVTEEPAIQGMTTGMAGGAVFRTGHLFSKRRFTIALEIDGVLFPELHLHARTRRSAKSQARFIAQSAGEILLASGMMQTAYQRITAARSGRPVLPASMDTVYLTVDIGEYPAGTPGVVMWSGWDDDVEDINQYPVTVKLGEVNAPLALGEWSTEKPADK